jgi:serine O-acetyltransferase
MTFWSAVKADVAANHKSLRYSAKAFLILLASSTGFQLLLSYRLQHSLMKLSIPGKILSKILFILTKWLIPCDINPYASIAGGVRIPHAIGIVIARSAIIETGVTLYQHVTIGQRNEQAIEAATIRQGAVLYAGAVIIGNITIGRNAVVGANAVVTQDVPDDYLAAGIPAQLRPKRS